MVDEKKQDHYLVLNSVLTHVITWGSPLDCKGQDVIVCITGNPGLPDFYIEFASKLYEQTQFHVCVIGQAGHEVTDDKADFELYGNLFNLEGQIQHKVDFINKIDNTCKLHIIGHSIGAWEVVEIMNRQEELISRVATINLLFPTLQNMAETRNGKFLNNITRPLNFLIILIIHIFSLIPQLVQDYLMKVYLRYNSLPIEYVPRVKKFLNPTVVKNVLYLAYDEMDTVKTINTIGLDKIKHVTNVIYSIRDDWAPLHYIEDLKMFKPKIHLNQVNINHSFVLKSSVRVAHRVVEFIKKVSKH